MLTTQCPERQTIEDLLNGRLDDQESGSLFAHLDQCDHCDTVAQELEGQSDWLLRHVRAIGRDDSPGDAAFANQPTWLPRVRDAVGSDGREIRTADSAHESEPSPHRIGAYEVQGLLGRGGMGTVYRAIHQRLQREVALKVVRLPGPEAEMRFEREMRTVAALDHPAIVRATDAGNCDGYTFLAMERIVGSDVGRVLRQYGPLEIADACEIVRQAALGLAVAHEQGVIHRDIKPSNLMLTTDGQVKILDFGLATHSDMANASFATSMGRLLGTLDFLAPEQTGTAAVDARADIYSLGATLFALLAGQPPLGRAADVSVIQHLQRLATSDAPSVTERRPDVPAALAELINRMLHRDAAQRPGSVGEVAEALREFVDGADLQGVISEISLPHEESATGFFPQRSSAGSSGITGTDSTGKPPFSGTTGRGRWRPIVIGILGLLLIGAGAVAGILFYLETGEGRLRIESDVPGVEIRVTRSTSKRGETIRVRQTSESVQLRAGVYRIQVMGAADEIELSANRVRVMRGESVLLLVTRQPAADAGRVVGREPGDGDRADDSSDPLEQRLLASGNGKATWKGQSVAEWLRVFRRELEGTQRMEAADALVVLSSRLPPNVAGELLMEVGESIADDLVDKDPNQVAHLLLLQKKLWGRSRSDQRNANRSLNDFFRRDVESRQTLLTLSQQLGQLPVETLSSLLETSLAAEQQTRLAVLLHALYAKALTGDVDARTAAALQAVLDRNEKTPVLVELVVDVLDPSSTPSLTGYLASRPERVEPLVSLFAVATALQWKESVSMDDAATHIGLAMRDDTPWDESLVYDWASDQFQASVPGWHNRLVQPLITRLSRQMGASDFFENLAFRDLDGCASQLLEIAEQLDVTVENRQSLVGWLDTLLLRLAEYRDRVELPMSDETMTLYTSVSDYFQWAGMIRVVLSSEIPAVWLKAPRAESVVGTWLHDFHSRPSNLDTQRFSSKTIETLYAWCPLQVFASCLNVRIDGVPSEDDREAVSPRAFGVRENALLEVIAASLLSGRSREADEVFRQMWEGAKDGPELQIETGRPGESRIAKFCGGFRRPTDIDPLLLRIADKAIDDGLGLVALAAATDSAEISQPVDKLLASESLRFRIWAIQLLAQRGLLEGREQRVVDILAEPGFTFDVGRRSANWSHHDQYVLTRLKMLEEFEDQLLAPHAPAILRAIPRIFPVKSHKVLDLEGNQHGVTSVSLMLSIALRFPVAVREESVAAQHVYVFYRDYEALLDQNLDGRRLWGELQQLRDVLAVDRPRKVGVISATSDSGNGSIAVGLDDGIEVGQLFDVYRDQQWIAVVRVSGVTNDEAVVKSRGENTKLLVDDTVMMLGFAPTSESKEHKSLGKSGD